MSEELKKEWRDEFDEEFGSFLDSADMEFGPWDGTSSSDKIKSFISSLLAKQQEEFVRIVKNRTGVIAYADTDKGTVERILISRDDLFADIKSKLNKTNG
jgi:hypothetical protein